MSDTGAHRDDLGRDGLTGDDATREVPVAGSTTGSTTGSTPGSTVGSTVGSTPEAETTLHRERMVTGTELHETGKVRVRKHVETHPVEYSVPREVEHADTSERVNAEEGDSGEVEVLEDGSVSIPIFEEVLVVTKRLVVRERVIVRKHTVVDEHTLQTELRREHVTVDADEGVDLDDRTGVTGGTGVTGSTGSVTDRGTDDEGRTGRV